MNIKKVKSIGSDILKLTGVVRGDNFKTYMKNFALSIWKIALGIVIALLVFILILKIFFSPIVKIDSCRVIILGGLLDINHCDEKK